MKVLSYNIKAGTGISGGHLAFWNYLKSKDRILNSISKNILNLQPDIIGLVEIDAGSFRSRNQVEYLAQKLHYNYVSACKYGGASTLPILKYQHLAIFSKYEILKTKKHKFSKGFKRLALEAILRIGKEKVSVVITHLSLGRSARNRQLIELSDIIGNIKNKIIVLGDFNDENIILNNLNVTSEGTFPSWNPQKQFDYIFSNCKIKESKVLPWKLSDHLPIFAEIEP